MLVCTWIMPFVMTSKVPTLKNRTKQKKPTTTTTYKWSQRENFRNT